MSSLPVPFYDVTQIRAIERAAINNAKISETALMERAGFSAFQHLLEQYDHIDHVAVFCGKGNNGGDGFVLARLAHEMDMRVSVFSLCGVEVLPPTAQEAARACMARGIDIQPFRQPLVLDADVYVDAILGIGLSGEVRGEAAQMIEFLNQAETPVFAIDIPSGLHAETGAVLGDAVIAEHTVTFIGVKQGLLTGQAADYCGQIHCEDLGLEHLLANSPAAGFRLTLGDVENALTPRLRCGHKGLYGHVLVIGGDYGMAGAARMAAEAACRTGAGLVSVATRPEHISSIISSRPEIMAHGIDDVSQLDALIEKATTIVLGPGLSDSQWSRDLYAVAMASSTPLIVDAGALSLLAEKTQLRHDWVLTPHPGEAARLLQSDSTSVQADRFQALEAIQQRYHAVVVLKGAGTLIKTADQMPECCMAANPAMASGGMGDVLSGILASLHAQGYSLFDAARMGVVIHAVAAERAAVQGERGTLAMDLMSEIRAVVNPSMVISVDEAEDLLQDMLFREYSEYDAERHTFDEEDE